MVGSKKGKQVQICSYYPPEMADQLKALAERTRVPLATYLREAAEDLLDKYEDVLQRTPPKPSGSKGRR
jgi:predicted DNA-binding protein